MSLNSVTGEIVWSGLVIVQTSLALLLWNQLE